MKKIHKLELEVKDGEYHINRLKEKEAQLSKQNKTLTEDLDKTKDDLKGAKKEIKQHADDKHSMTKVMSKMKKSSEGITG